MGLVEKEQAAYVRSRLYIPIAVFGVAELLFEMLELSSPLSNRSVLWKVWAWLLFYLYTVTLIHHHGGMSQLGGQNIRLLSREMTAI